MSNKTIKSLSFRNYVFSHPDALILAKKFRRKCPTNDVYVDRLAYELNLIIKKDFVHYLLQVCEILDLVYDIPHIIRGSSGSSLVCYLLGLGNVDPVKEDISFARFLSYTRDNMPDVDADFPYDRREEVFQRIYQRWDGKVARISNHLYYQEKSALRQAIREQGYDKFISKHKCSANIIPEKRDEILKRKHELIGTFRQYSLHCGGIIIYDEGVPKDLILDRKDDRGIQIKYNKDDVERVGKFKIDILSNRGLTQLFDISKKSIEDYPAEDLATELLFHEAHNIGLTFAESPIMRKAIMILKPNCIKDLALCLALIRPIAGGKKHDFFKEEKGDFMIFDDDAIHYIQKLINCDEAVADKYRRSFAKKKWKDTMYFEFVIKDFKNKEQIMENLNQLRKYSFCKSHAFSYAKLVWALAYQKAHHPLEFWVSTLNHCNSMYRKWVHFSEAKKAGLKLTLGRRPWKLDGDTLVSVHVKKTKKKHKAQEQFSETKKLTSIEEYNEHGYWTSSEFLPNMYVKVCKHNPDFVEFRGLIATGRWYYSRDKTKKSDGVTFITIGYASGHFIDLTIQGHYKIGIWDVVRGKGKIKQLKDYLGIDVREVHFESLK